MCLPTAPGAPAAHTDRGRASTQASITSNTVLELTYNWGVESYELGTAFGHLAIGVPDVYEACEKMKAMGGKIIRDAGPMNAGKTIIAFLEDPDGYEIELIGRD